MVYYVAITREKINFYKCFIDEVKIKKNQIQFFLQCRLIIEKNYIPFLKITFHLVGVER